MTCISELLPRGELLTLGNNRREEDARRTGAQSQHYSSEDQPARQMIHEMIHGLRAAERQPVSLC
jgi:hypothetical protein